ncbi:MinD/ParA family ATP-binding protein [Salana multivorans]
MTNQGTYQSEQPDDAQHARDIEQVVVPVEPERPPATRRELRQSFLTKEQTEEPASKGWRGFLASLGIRVSPSEDEGRERAAVQAVSQHWPGPRTVAVVNGKGGANKTPSTILLAAVFARYGGAGVLAWDNNQTRGTLGWRTEQGPHEATLLELLPQTGHLLGTGAQSADLARYVHHQTRDRFDVLRSKPMALAHEQRVEPEDVDAIHAVAAKYYRLIVMDSGNDESDPMWLRMIDHADQLVVATTTRDDHAEAGALLLEALAERDQHSADLASGAVAVISQADPKATRADVERVVTGYQTLARETITIPFDPAMVDGVLRFGSLRRTTQRAWLDAAAAVARGL